MSHYMFIERFKSHCLSKGIHLLKDDTKFLYECLNGLKIDESRMILKAYLKKWIESEEKGLPGRREANIALREYLGL